MTIAEPIKKKEINKTIENTKNELFDTLIKEYKTSTNPKDPNDLLKSLSKGVLERMLSTELTDHLGYDKHTIQLNENNNYRNGFSPKTVKTNLGNIHLKIPRDRKGEFDPIVIPKGETRFTGFDDKVISLYTSGLSTRDIEDHLKEIYDVNVSPDFISKITNAVSKEVLEWQNRPLDKLYPILYLDAIRLKIRTDGKVINKAIYLALAVNMDGQKEILGMWAQANEGAKFWMGVMAELKNRGLQDILIACVDGLKGFPEAIEAVYPNAEVQLCIVHMIRNSIKYISYKERKKVANDLKLIYKAPTIEQAKEGLEEFKLNWDKSYPSISRMWENNWKNIIPFFQYTEDIRKAIYTTNAIESINMSIRRTTKTRGSFPDDESAFKLLYLGLKKASKKWNMPIRNWGQAISQLAIHFEGRVSFNQE